LIDSDVGDSQLNYGKDYPAVIMPAMLAWAMGRKFFSGWNAATAGVT
jgi:hypothetical protein